MYIKPRYVIAIACIHTRIYGHSRSRSTRRVYIDTYRVQLKLWRDRRRCGGNFLNSPRLIPLFRISSQQGYEKEREREQEGGRKGKRERPRVALLRARAAISTSVLTSCIAYDIMTANLVELRASERASPSL